MMMVMVLMIAKVFGIFRIRLAAAVHRVVAIVHPQQPLLALELALAGRDIATIGVATLALLDEKDVSVVSISDSESELVPDSAVPDEVSSFESSLPSSLLLAVLFFCTIGFGLLWLLRQTGPQVPLAYPNVHRLKVARAPPETDPVVFYTAATESGTLSHCTIRTLRVTNRGRRYASEALGRSSKSERTNDVTNAGKVESGRHLDGLVSDMAHINQR
uniref:Fibronectin type III domain-containing protein n=1 Tax=Anopheles melas TaxID=34690 RepID=A0A182U1M0_9DIPT